MRLGREWPASELTERILGAAIEVHRAMGPGLLESVYEECLAFELMETGLKVQRQVALPVRYKGRELGAGYRLDLVVEDTVLIEVKAVSHLESIHEAQVLTYLRLTEKSVALLINFNVPLLRDGVKRLVMTQS
ncbi:MAG: GxxExxY protein [Planctomycetota bacterium]